MPIKFEPPFKLFRQDADGEHLDPDSLEKLRDVVAGRSTIFPREQALALLVESGFARAHEDLGQILSNEDEPATLRYQAAIYLARTGAATAERLLIQNSQINDARVLAGVARALGRIGGASALESVRRIEAQTDGYVQLQAAFSARLISHRLKMDGSLPQPDTDTLPAPPRNDGRAITFKIAEPDQVETCLRSIARESYGIAYAADNILRLECGGVIWMLLLNREYARPDAVNQLSQHRAFAAVLTRYNELMGHFSISRLILTAPGRSAGTIDVQVYQPSGNMVYAGIAQVKDQKASLSLRAIARPGAPGIAFTGEFEGGRFSTLRARASRTVQVQKRQPIPSR